MRVRWFFEIKMLGNGVGLPLRYRVSDLLHFAVGSASSKKR